MDARSLLQLLVGVTCLLSYSDLGDSLFLFALFLFVVSYVLNKHSNLAQTTKPIGHTDWQTHSNLMSFIPFVGPVMDTIRRYIMF